MQPRDQSSVAGGQQQDAGAGRTAGLAEVISTDHAWRSRRTKERRGRRVRGSAAATTPQGTESVPSVSSNRRSSAYIGGHPAMESSISKWYGMGARLVVKPKGVPRTGICSPRGRKDPGGDVLTERPSSRCRLQGQTRCSIPQHPRSSYPRFRVKERARESEERRRSLVRIFFCGDGLGPDLCAKSVKSLARGM